MRNRSVIEIMVIMFTLVVALVILGLGAVIVVVEITDPKADTAGVVRALVSVITLILGSLLGLLAGKTSMVNDLGKRPSEGDEL